MNEHIPNAFYEIDDSEENPVLECSCGWSTGPCISWWEAGHAFDEHLEDIR